MIVLNVGCGESRALPAEFDGWQQVLLDIDPAVQPDIVCDALNLLSLPPARYDGVHCSHNLEHFYAHDVPRVLAGFKHVLKPGGLVYITVPNLRSLMQKIVGGNLDIDDVWYRAGECSPVTFHDVLFGWSLAMRQGNLFYAHKCGFTPLSLNTALVNAGFVDVKIAASEVNIIGTARTCH